jgi:hypothetical protein
MVSNSNLYIPQMPIPNVNDNVNDNGDDSIQSIKDKIAENDKMINTLEKMLKSKRLNGLGDSNSNMQSSQFIQLQNSNVIQPYYFPTHTPMVATVPVVQNYVPFNNNAYQMPVLTAVMPNY